MQYLRTKRRRAITVPGPDRSYGHRPGTQPAHLLMSWCLHWLYPKGSQRTREPVCICVLQINRTVRGCSIGSESYGYGVEKSHRLPSARWKQDSMAKRPIKWGLLALPGVQGLSTKSCDVWGQKETDVSAQEERVNLLFLRLFCSIWAPYR